MLIKPAVQAIRTESRIGLLRPPNAIPAMVISDSPLDARRLRFLRQAQQQGAGRNPSINHQEEQHYTYFPISLSHQTKVIFKPICQTDDEVNA